MIRILESGLKNRAALLHEREEHNMAVKEEITAAANRELNRANEQFPLFTSKHDGYQSNFAEHVALREFLRCFSHNYFRFKLIIVASRHISMK